jgi:glutamyl-tRNA reductase
MSSYAWYLAVCGISHKTSTVNEREPLQMGREDIARAHADFVNLDGVNEAAILSTCNRIELYFVANKKYDAFEIIRAFFRKSRNLDIIGLREKFYIKKNKHTADHLFRVAAGIDSMVIGENQILGQVRDAYSSACAVKAAGKVIHRLFHQAFRVGKQVRSDTEMGKGACSVSSAAVEMLQEKLKAFEKPSILFIGLNQMIALAASGLNKLEYNRFTFANRTPEKAVAFGAGYNAPGFSLKELPSLLEKSDLIISCTGSSEPIITRQIIDNLPRQMTANKIIMDLAVPRDVEIDNGYKSNIEILNIEDIHKFVRDQQTRREQAIPQAEEIIEQKLGEFVYWYDHVRHEPFYNGLDNVFEDIRRRQMTSVLSKLSPEMRDEVDKASQSLVNKLLHLKIRTDPENK